jgi:anti-anti-sigma regulatory factor
MVDISVSDLDSHVLMKITGSIRLTDAESLKNPFEQVLEESGKNVMVDLKDSPSMSSLGIGKVLFLNERLKKENRTMEIIGI